MFSAAGVSYLVSDRADDTFKALSNTLASLSTTRENILIFTHFVAEGIDNYLVFNRRPVCKVDTF